MEGIPFHVLILNYLLFTCMVAV